MFRAISWQQYFTTILIVIILYYLFIAALYFRLELLKLVQKQNGGTPAEDVPSINEKSSDLFSTVTELKKSLQEVLKKGQENKSIKEELIMSLRGALRASIQLKGTAFQVAINNYIILECNNMCQLELTDADVQQLWN